MLHDRYHIVDKLGFGGSSTVWLARATRLTKYVGVKIRIADSLPRDQCAHGFVCTAAIVFACTPWAWSTSLSSGGIRGARSDWKTSVLHSDTCRMQSERDVFQPSFLPRSCSCALIWACTGCCIRIGFSSALDGIRFPFSCSPNARFAHSPCLTQRTKPGSVFSVETQ